MSFDENLLKIANATENTQSQTPELANAARLSSLYDTYLTAQETETNAPAAVTVAEKEYYEAKDGSDGYSKRIADRNKIQSQQLKDKLIAAHAIDVDLMDAQLSNYTTTVTYANNSESIVLSQLNKVITLADSIKTGTDIQVTNDRKSTYLDIERNMIASWDSYLTIAIWVLALTYAKINYQSINMTSIAIFTSIVLSPWILSLIGWIFNRNIAPFNIYTTFI